MVQNKHLKLKQQKLNLQYHDEMLLFAKQTVSNATYSRK